MAGLDHVGDCGGLTTSIGGARADAAPVVIAGGFGSTSSEQVRPGAPRPGVKPRNSKTSGFPCPRLTTSFFGKCAEAEMPCLGGVQLEPETLKAFTQVGAKPSHVGLMLEPSARSSAYRTTITSTRDCRDLHC
jgi:hypothetical protein